MKTILSKEEQASSSLFSPIILLAFFGFALVGLSGGASGVLLPSLSFYYHVDNAVLGLLFLVSSLGYFLMAFTSGLLVERLGLRGFLILGAVLFLIGDAGFGLKPPFVLVLLSRLSLGLGVGVVETGLNIYVSRLTRSDALLNYLHAFYGVGALVGPVVASTILFLNWGWNSVYFILGGLCLPMLLGFILLFKKETRALPSKHDEQKGKGTMLGDTLKIGVVWLAALFLLFYVGIEVSLGNWTYTFLLNDRHQNALLSGWIVSGYWFGLTMGRFVLQRTAERLKISNTQLIYGCLMSVIIALLMISLIHLPVVAALGFCLIGFSLGPMYPLTVALTPRLVPERIAASAIGFLVSVSIIGLALFPWLAGVLAQSAGTWTLLPYTIALTIVAFGFWWSVFHRKRERTSSKIV